MSRPWSRRGRYLSAAWLDFIDSFGIIYFRPWTSRGLIPSAPLLYIIDSIVITLPERRASQQPSDYLRSLL